MPTVEKTIALKVPVSLRLPVSLVRQVESYAQENHLTKTDAYEHFLRLGLESDAGEESPMAQLDLFHEKLDKILYFVSFEEKDSEKNSDIDEKNAVIQAIRDVSVQFPAIKKGYLFGSFARGTFNKESDIDIRIKLDRSASFNLRDLAQYAKRIERICDREVDVISSKKTKSKQLEAAINQDKELVYERKGQ